MNAPSLVLDCRTMLRSDEAAARRAVRKMADPPAPRNRAGKDALDLCHRAWLAGLIDRWTWTATDRVMIDGTDYDVLAAVSEIVRRTPHGQRLEWGPRWIGRRDVVLVPDADPIAVAPKVKRPSATRPKLVSVPDVAPAPIIVEMPPPAPTPISVGQLTETIAAYLARLVYEPKRAYAAAYVGHRCEHGPLPSDPGTDWAEKVRVKVEKMMNA